LKVVGIANNGQEAIQKVQALKPDVITLDVEMPVMDGITALKQIVKIHPVKALMLSSLTYEGAKLTLDALDAGAADFMLKSYEGISQSGGQMATALRERVKEIAKVKSRPASVAPAPKAAPPPAKIQRNAALKLIAIGASTGGPVALQKVLCALPGNFSLPITVTQHMPGTFTGAFAQRLNSLAKLTILEAQDGMLLKPGHVYIGPGGKQMLIDGSASNLKLKVKDTDARLQYAPSVDVTYASAAKVLSNQVLAIVLTGMGADGRDGARLLKQAGSTVWTQDEQSCVVYGMPMSVKKAGLSDLELAIEAFPSHILRMV
jgi:two-component system chemotaxis response regulator CheB